VADLTQDSFDETKLFFKVLFQRGRDIRDSELNEFQDILRFLLARQFADGIQRNPSGSLNPGSNDNGYLVVPTVATGSQNLVTLKAGTLFCDGIPVKLAVDTVMTGFSTPGPGLSRTDVVYLAITEAEVADPSATPLLGETTRRRQLQVVPTFTPSGMAGMPTSTAAEIFAGGNRFFPIGLIARTATGVIGASGIQDLRKILPPGYIGILQSYAGSAFVGARGVTGTPYATPTGTVLGQIEALTNNLNSTERSVSVSSGVSGIPWTLASGVSVFAHEMYLLEHSNDEYRSRTIIANQTVDDAGFRDRHIFVGSGAGAGAAFAISLTLPNPASCIGRELWIGDRSGRLAPTSATGGSIELTLNRFGTEKIDESSERRSLVTPFGRWRVSCDGVGWIVSPG
jgi:hypothetical protein